MARGTCLSFVTLIHNTVSVIPYTEYVRRTPRGTVAVNKPNILLIFKRKAPERSRPKCNHMQQNTMLRSLFYIQVIWLAWLIEMIELIS